MSSNGRKNAAPTAAAMLAAGRSVTDTAKAVGVSERTVNRWGKLPKFTRMVRRLRGQMVSDATGKLASGMGAASDTLVSLLLSIDETVKLRAAAEILKTAVKLKEFSDLEQRIKLLEQANGGRRL